MPAKKKQSSEAAVREIRRRARRRFSAEEKIRIVLEGLRGEESIAAAPEAAFVLFPVPDSVLRVVLAVDSARLPCGHSIAPSTSMMGRDPEPMLAQGPTPIHAPTPLTKATAGHFWVRWPMGEILTEHVQSLQVEPPKQPGTPDPYSPQSGK